MIDPETEKRRRAYLEQLGVRCHFPRYPLPGAGPSHEFAQPAPAEAEPEPATPEAHTPETHDGSARDPRAAAADGDAPVDSESESTEPRFAFAWLAIDQELAVAAELAADGSRLPVPCRQMLMRILAALAPRYRQARPEERIFRWPLTGTRFPAGDDNGGISAGREAARGFIGRCLREAPTRHLLIFASEPPAWLYADDDRREAIKGHLAHDELLGLDILQVPSLQAMNAEPELKRPAWEAMQALAHRLQQAEDGR